MHCYGGGSHRPLTALGFITLKLECEMSDVSYPCYWQRKDASGFWYWLYYARNGEAIARSSVNRSDCTHSISLMKGSSDSAVFYSE